MNQAVDPILLVLGEWARRQQKGWNPYEADRPGQGLYAIGSKQGPIKFGIAKNVENRRKELQIGNPLKLSILFYQMFDMDMNVASCEKKLHRKFINQRLEGEWFQIDEIEAFAGFCEVIAEWVVTIGRWPGEAPIVCRRSPPISPISPISAVRRKWKNGGKYSKKI